MKYGKVLALLPARALTLSQFDSAEKPVIPAEARAAWGEEAEPWE